MSLVHLFFKILCWSRFHVIKNSSWYRHIYEAFETPLVFNLYQTIVDGGKGRQIKRFLKDVPYTTVVDIGCGTGNWATIARGPYVGIDTSPSFIEGCRQRYAGQDDRKFIHGDAASLELDEEFDLAILVSVLHHLSDDAVGRLLPWVTQNARFFFVLDLYPIPVNPISRLLYAMDRGDHIRTPEQQKDLLLRAGGLRSVKEGSYFCPNGIYRHTLFLFERDAEKSNL